MTCSCGEAARHEIARRRTADDRQVVFWSDGDITMPLGFGIPGLGRVRRPGAAARRAADLALGVVGLYDLAEIAQLVKIARRAVAQTSLEPATYLARVMEGERFRRAGRHGAVVIAERCLPVIVFQGCERRLTLVPPAASA